MRKLFPFYGHSYVSTVIVILSLVDVNPDFMQFTNSNGVKFTWTRWFSFWDENTGEY